MIEFLENLKQEIFMLMAYEEYDGYLDHLVMMIDEKIWDLEHEG